MMTLLPQKKLYYSLEPRAASPVAMATLGLREYTRARPNEVVDWYPNGVAQNYETTRHGDRGKTLS